jgi:two-component system, OmpR family, sensor kinase
MKLLQKTNIYYLIFSALLFLIASIVLFKLLTFISERELDESLVSGKNKIAQQIENATSLPQLPPLILVKEVKDISGKEMEFKDTMIYNSTEKEMEPYREISSVENINGKFYSIVVRRSLIETEDIRLTIGLSVGGVLLLLLAGLFFINRKIAESVWTPFYNNLGILRKFSFEQSEPVMLQSSGIVEFEELNHTIEKLISKVHADYQQLKEFTENASHESQTPLAIIQSKLELLMQHTGLDEEQAALIESIGLAVQRLNKLNHALLLLAKIENRQYSAMEDLNLSEIVKNQIGQFTDLIEAREITLNMQVDKDIKMHGDHLLLDVLLFNLLNNAVKHNTPKGTISIRLSSAQLVISNLGKPLTIEPDKLFERFYKADPSSGSLGLGLSIVRKICEVSGYQVSYLVVKNLHTITISF